MAPSHVERPKPTGINKRGVPLWDSQELSAFRAAHGVTQAQVGRQLQIPQSSIAAYFENVAGVVALTDERAAAYFDAIEEAARRVERDRASAAAYIAEIRARRARGELR